MTLQRTLLVTLLSLAGSASVWAECGEAGVAVQILGSGGPTGSSRASAGYIVWIDGVSRIMVDAGGGTFAHFHESGAKVDDLQLLALSHFHPDHSAEVPAILWPRGGNLRVSGPSGSAGFPSLGEFLDGLFGANGVFRVLNSRASFDPVTVDAAVRAPVEVLADEEVRVSAIGVPHGRVPALAYRVEVGGSSVVFSSDQNGSDPAFVKFSRGADVLIVHFAGSEEGGRAQSRNLHAKPSVWGQIATDAEVGALVLSHISSNQDFDANLAHLKSRYSGPLVVAEDLICVAVD